jgi:phosphoglycolate phosphatase-like HAD superfamily hydrolase
MPRTLNGLRPVVALDIDGTLGAHHAHVVRFAEQYLGKSVGCYCVATALEHGLHGVGCEKDYAGGSFARYMGISKETYRQVKLAYRQGGLKRSMPAYPYARELSVTLRRAGVEVWICTTRPYLRLDNIDPDTRHWLRRHGIQYDGVVFGERKYRDLARIVGVEAVVAVLEDLPEMALHANEQGLFVLLRDQPYNRPPGFHGQDWRGLRVEDLEEAAAEIGGMLDNWKDKRK